jgi:hypothetical protein
MESNAMNVLQAAAVVGKEFPGGIAALAKRIKRNPTTLAHELTPPGGSTAKLGLATAVEMTDAADDDRILFAWAVSRGYTCVRLVASKPDQPKTLLEATSRFAKETGEALSAMHEAIQSGHITANNVHSFEREVSEIAPAAIALVDRMRSAAAHQRLQHVPAYKTFQARESVAL